MTVREGYSVRVFDKTALWRILEIKKEAGTGGWEHFCEEEL
jgi:hypothetical protein